MPRRFVAELAGTFGLVFFAAGAVMIDELSGGTVTHVGSAITSGLIVTAMIYTVGHVSGAHINPAVTLGIALTRHLPWKQALLYWCAQVLGAVAAAGVLRALFGLVAGMGGHVPSGSAAQSFGLEIVLTFFLVFVIMAVATDRRAVGQGAALAIGATVLVGVLIGGPISGGSMNPARSFGPALVGWTWTDHWVYWAGPLVGATLGGLSYHWLSDNGAQEGVASE